MSNAVKLPRVYIDRKSWGRGSYCGDNGRCCAIGFVAKNQLKREGKKRPTNDQITTRANQISSNFPNITAIYNANDDLKGKERIKVLREEFKKAGYQLVLVN